MPPVPATSILPMAWVDAFTTTPFAGNQCVVVFGADGVDDATRTAFTRETGLSECAFLQASTVADVGVRYHVASGPIPMAGHPTIATVAALLDRGLVDLVGGRATFTLEVGVGVLPIEVDATGDGPPVITMRQLRPTFGTTWPAADIAPLVGLTAADFRADPQTVSTGTPFLVSPLVDHDALRRARLDVAALVAFHDAHDTDFFEPFLTAMGGATGAGDVFSRLLLTPPEPPEDPFTGAATGCLGAWLWHHGEIPGPSFVAEQGHDMGRPGLAHVQVVGPPDDIEAVRVGGSGVVVMRGEVVLATSRPGARDATTDGTTVGSTTTGATTTGATTTGATTTGGTTTGSTTTTGNPLVRVQPGPSVGIVAAAPSGVTAFIGETEKHLDGGIVEATTFDQFTSLCGGTGPGAAMALSVEQFFTNGGSRAIVASAAPTTRGHHAARTLVAATDADLVVMPVDGTADVPERITAHAIDWAEDHGVMVLLDPPASWAGVGDIRTVDVPVSANATLWTPRGRAADGSLMTLTGAIAGVIARTDQDEGVWKAPAGMDARVLDVDLDVALTPADFSVLADTSVNGLQRLRGQVVVWGARTLSDDADWTYIPVRRTALWLRRSITRSLDATLPAIDDTTMATVVRQVNTFMEDLYRQGALVGASPRDAWFVRCDATTTTAADRDRGVAHVVVGFAPLRPTEFIVLTIPLRAASD